MSVTTSPGQAVVPVPVTQPVPVGIPAAAPAPLPDLPDDPDDRAVALAKAEVAANERAGGSTPQPTTTPNDGQQAPRRDLRVPKSRYDEVAGKNRTLEQEVAYLKGALEARAGGAGQPQGQQPQQQQAQPTKQDQIKAIEQQIVAEQQKMLAAAAQFDNGEISMSQYKGIELAANNLVASLRERVVIDAVRAEMPRPTTSLADQDLLARHQAEMEARHPWVTTLTNAELMFLADQAKNELAALGRPIGTGPAETVRLRTRVAELASKFGPDWYPSRQVAAPAQPAAAQQQPQPQQRGAAGAAKIALAAAHPPNVNQAGTATGGAAIPTTAQIERMSTDEIAALPAEVRRRALER